MTGLLRRLRGSRLLSAATIGLPLMLLVGTVASADTAPVTFNGCLTPGGTLIQITADGQKPSCPPNTTLVSWNQVGPQGPVGPTGPPGPTGPQGAQGVQGQTGATGAQGPQGPQGPAGANGNTVLSGTGAPSSATGRAGDFYVDTSTDVLYGPKTASGWPTVGTSLIGPQGQTGVAGPRGPAGPAGPQGPAGPPGAAGSVLNGIDQFNGVSCSLTSSLTGAVKVTYGAGGVITLTCVANNSLAVKFLGSGGGSVASADGAVNCSASCSHLYFQGAQVTLTATPNSTSNFGGWAGACTGTQPTCTLTINGPAEADATFNPKPPVALSVQLSGTAGHVTSSPAGLDCAEDGTFSQMCIVSFTGNTVVTLTAAPPAGSIVSAWGGACSGSGLTCTVTMSSAQNVTVRFVPGWNVTVIANTSCYTAQQSDGSLLFYCVSGQVSTPNFGTCTNVDPFGNPNGPATCVTPIPAGTQVTFTEGLPAGASPAGTFTGWSGDCSGTQSTCTLTINSAKTVQANFK